MLFHQMFDAESSTYTYLLADVSAKEAILIDPVLEQVERDLRLIEDYGLRLKYICDTHVHADHVTAADTLRARTGAKTCISAKAGLPCVDVPLKEGDELSFGSYTLKALETPGHTNCSISYLTGDRVFTGDTLLIRGCGRTDFQNGSAEELFSSVRQKLFTLPDSTLVFPGHDYKGQTSSSILMEKSLNPRLKEDMSLSDFVKIMSNLGLAAPKKINEAVPLNLACGKKETAV